MKFLLLLVVLAAFVYSSLGLKNAICGLPHYKYVTGDTVCNFRPTWSYNGTACAFFKYGGCGGNENQFDSKEDCESMCLE